MNEIDEPKPADKQERGEAYQEMQLRIAILCSSALSFDGLEEHLRAQERALDFGYFADPTLWIKKHKALEEDKNLARAVLNFKVEVQKLLGEERVAAIRARR